MRRGQSVSDETRRKMSESAQRRAQREIDLGIRRPALGMRHTEEFKRMVSEMFKGKHLGVEHRRKIGEANKRNNNEQWLRKLVKGQRPVWTDGKQTGPKNHKWSVEQRRALAERQRGDKSHFWRGGQTPEIVLARLSLDYAEWRQAVLARDKHTCQDCGKVSRRNHAHHIVPLREDAALRFVVSNGTTLCASCHKRRESAYIVSRKRGEFGGPPTGTIPSRAEPEKTRKV